MTLPAVTNPYSPIVGLNGLGLNQGSMYIGVDGQDPQTYPQACFWDAAGTVPVTQPITIIGGYPTRLGTPAQVYTADTYSIRVRDRQGAQVFYVPSAVPGPSTRDGIFATLADAQAASIPVAVRSIGVQTLGYSVAQDGGGASWRYSASMPSHPGRFQSADGAWWEIVADDLNVKAFGAAEGGVTQNQTAFSNGANALVTGGALDIPFGDYLVGSAIYGPAKVTVQYHDTASIGTTNIVTNSTFTGSPATGWTLSNFTSLNPTVSHTPGSVGSAQRSATISSYAIYLISVTLTTTTQGGIAFNVAGSPVFDASQYSVIPTGASVTYQFEWRSGSLSGSQVVELFTDTAWAGTVHSWSIVKVSRETQFSFMSVPTDDKDFYDPYGIKFGRFNAGNIAIGDRETYALGGTSAAWNVAVGARALATAISAQENTAVGAFALQYNQANQLTAVGYSALKYNTTGTLNAAFGFKALCLNSTGTNNVALGYFASFLGTTGSFNTAGGYQALYYNTVGSYNTAFGNQAGLTHNTGQENVYFGHTAGSLGAGGPTTYNYSFTSSLGAETKCYGSRTTAVGFQARCGSDPNAGGTAITTSAVAVGYAAVANADESVVVGPQATATATTSIRSTVVGKQAKSSGAQAVSIGFLADATDLSVSMGSQAGVNLTGVNNVSIGYGCNNYGGATAYSGIVTIGYGATATGSNQFTLGSSSITTLRCQQTAITALSDERYKCEITPLDIPDAFLDEVAIMTFFWDRSRDENLTPDMQVGVIAQQIDALQTKYGLEWLGLVDKSNPDRWEATPHKLLFPLILRTQRLAQRVAALESLAA